MAARRLVVVMMVLLVASTIAAVALTPTRSGPGGQGPGPAPTTTEKTRTEAAPVDTLPKGRLLRARISTRDDSLRVVPIRLGDQLELTVESARPGLVSIPSYGESERADRFSAARFDLLPRERGRLRILFATDDERERVIGWVGVSGPR